jgi:hypothetical protein
LTEYIVYTLWALIAAAALYKRSGAAAVYFFAIIAHHVLLGWVDNRWYYVSAGVFDLAAAVILMRMSTRSRTGLALIAISAISVVLNTVGYGIYIDGMMPQAYNISFIVLYFAALVAVMGGGIRVGGINTGVAHLLRTVRGVSKGLQKGQI